MGSDAPSCAAWHSILEEPPPAGIELEISIVEGGVGDIETLVEPVRWTENGWISVETGRRLDLTPTHWRQWSHPERIRLG